MPVRFEVQDGKMTEKKAPRKGKVRLEVEMCKACGFCIEHCPSKSLVVSDQYNAKGYYPTVWLKDHCTGCGICAVVCPEAVIEVWREQKGE
jgi:2-oxoglutarate ferredoxin oxidoreductase subunit delta